jgi:hypothetical protein
MRAAEKSSETSGGQHRSVAVHLLQQNLLANTAQISLL